MGRWPSHSEPKGNDEGEQWGRVPPQEQVGRQWRHPRNQERAGVWPADGGAQWQMGHNWAAERALVCIPWEPGRWISRRKKGGPPLLSLPKALGLMAAGWERPRQDYCRVAEKNALHLDISAQTVAGSQRMTFQSQPAPPPRGAVVTQHRS